MKKGLKITLLTLVGLGLLSSTIYAIEQATNHGISDSIKDIFNKEEEKEDEVITLTIDDFGGVEAFNVNVNGGQYTGSNTFYKLEKNKKYKIDTTGFNCRNLLGFVNPVTSFDENKYLECKDADYTGSNTDLYYYYGDVLSYEGFYISSLDCSSYDYNELSFFSFELNPSYFDFFINVFDNYYTVDNYRKFTCDFLNDHFVLNDNFINSPYTNKYDTTDNGSIYVLNLGSKFYFTKDSLKENYFGNYALYDSGESSGNLITTSYTYTLLDGSEKTVYKINSDALLDNTVYQINSGYRTYIAPVEDVSYSDFSKLIV